ncbi:MULTISPECIES: YoaK family protein [unclassified Blastococcus]
MPGSTSTTSPVPAAPTAPTARPADRMTTGLRQALVVVLAVVSGATDAIGLIALGGAFTSVMTGNLVILGVSASTVDGALAIASGGAIVAFCIGAWLGARLAGGARPGDAVWPRPVTVGLAVELALLTAYAVGWWVSGGEPGSVLTQVLLFTMACALGIQSSTVQRFGVNGLSTTYLTGTLTTVVMKLTAGKGLGEVRGSLEILAGLVVGAAAGAALLELAPLTAPVLQVGGLAAVLLTAVVVTRRRG